MDNMVVENFTHMLRKQGVVIKFVVWGFGMTNFSVLNASVFSEPHIRRWTSNKFTMIRVLCTLLMKDIQDLILLRLD